MKITKKTIEAAVAQESVRSSVVIGMLYRGELFGYAGWRSGVVQTDPAESSKRCGAATFETSAQADAFIQKLNPNRTNLTVYDGLSYVTEVGRVSNPWKYWADRGREGYDLFYIVFDPALISYEVLSMDEASYIPVDECRSIIEEMHLSDVYPEIVDDRFDDFFWIFNRQLAPIMKGNFIKKYPTFNDILQAAIDPVVNVFVSGEYGRGSQFIEKYMQYVPEEIRDEVLTKVTEQLHMNTSDDIVTL